jgi:molybdate transport system substrate-binding protein
MKSLAAAIAISIAFACGCVPKAAGQQADILVSAAASLTDVLTGLSTQAQQYIGAKVLFNFGGSGALRKQLEEGAPVDVFFSASSEDMDALEGEGLVVTDTRKNLLSNAIVLIGGPTVAPVPGGSTAANINVLRALLSRADLLAIGNPDLVPAGRYAVRALTTYGLYPLVKTKLALGGNVREVLQYVQNGSAPLGIVFATDLLTASPGSVRQLFTFPDDSLGAPILYPIAVISTSKNKGNARKMIDFLQGDTARKAFRAAGFILR